MLVVSTVTTRVFPVDVYTCQPNSGKSSSLLTHAISASVCEHGVDIAGEFLDAGVRLGDCVEAYVVTPSADG